MKGVLKTATLRDRNQPAPIHIEFLLQTMLPRTRDNQSVDRLFHTTRACAGWAILALDLLPVGWVDYGL